jgi:DNA-binding transcriptional regulator YdaS (Cro superfamily)
MRVTFTALDQELLEHRAQASIKGWEGRKVDGGYLNELRGHYVGHAGELALERTLERFSWDVERDVGGWDYATPTTAFEVKTRLGEWFEKYGRGVPKITVEACEQRPARQASVVVSAQAHGVSTAELRHIWAVDLHGWEHLQRVKLAPLVMTSSSYGDVIVHQLEQLRPMSELLEGVANLERRAS